MVWTKGAHQSATFQTFNSSCQISPNFYFDGLLLLNVYKISAKMYRRVMSHDNEEWYKIWRKTNLLFQKWQEFGEFWSEHSKESKLYFFIGPFCAKYLAFDLKKYIGVTFHDTEESWKIWRKSNLWFGKWNEAFDKFSPKHLEVSKLGFWWDLFVQSRK